MIRSPLKASAKPTKRTCKNRACRNKFEPVRPMQSACCIGCAIILSKQKTAKDIAEQARKERQEIKVRKEAIKRRGEWVEDAQRAFNAYIRARDAGKPCIDCGKPFEPQKLGGSMDAGHYLSRGSAPHLRFDERNVHGQRKNCNRPGGATRAAFRDGLITRIGLEAVEALEADQTPGKWTIDELKAIKAEYRAKLKALAMDKGAE